MSGSIPDVVTLTPIEFHSRLGRGERITVLDVREADERGHCAINLPTNALDLHVPMRDVPARLDEIRAEAGQDLVVYCHHGVRSMTVANWLAHQGVRGVYNLTGGIDAWSRSVDPAVPRY